MLTAIECWILGFAVAIVLDGSQALSRSLLSNQVSKQRNIEKGRKQAESNNEA